MAAASFSFPFEWPKLLNALSGGQTGLGVLSLHPRPPRSENGEINDVTT